jgi:hypothetical protein
LWLSESLFIGRRKATSRRREKKYIRGKQAAEKLWLLKGAGFTGCGKNSTRKSFSATCLALAYVIFEIKRLQSLHANWALYQGTTLVGPLRLKNRFGL